MVALLTAIAVETSVVMTGTMMMGARMMGTMMIGAMMIGAVIIGMMIGAATSRAMMIGVMRGVVMIGAMMIGVMIGLVMRGATMRVIGVVGMTAPLPSLSMFAIEYARFMVTLLVTAGGAMVMILMMRLIVMTRTYMLLPMASTPIGTLTQPQRPHHWRTKQAQCPRQVQQT
jgi:hypothetical protein